MARELIVLASTRLKILLVLAIAGWQTARASPYVKVDIWRLNRARASPTRATVDLHPPGCSRCIEVINGFGEDIGNVAVWYRVGSYGPAESIHLPYIPAKSAARVYLSLAAYSNLPVALGENIIYVDDTALATAFDASQVRRALRSRSDCQIGSEGFTPGSGKPLTPAELLGLVEGTAALDLVNQVLLETKAGREQLILSVATEPKAPQVLALARRLGATSPAARSLVQKALNHPDGLDLIGPLGPLLRQQCDPRSPGAAEHASGLWNMAAHRFTGAAKAANLLAVVCPPSEGDLAALLDRASNDEMADLLGGLPLPYFLAACTSKRTSEEMLAGAMADAEDAGKLRAIVEGRCRPLGPEAIARTLLNGRALPATERRALLQEWFARAGDSAATREKIDLAVARILIKGQGLDEQAVTETAPHINWSHPETETLLRGELRSGFMLGAGVAEAFPGSPRSLFDILRFSWSLAPSCGAKAPDLAACGLHLDERPDLARYGLSPARVEAIESWVASRLFSPPDPALEQGLARLEPWGVSRVRAIALACDDSKLDLKTFEWIDPDRTCQARRARQAFIAEAKPIAMQALFILIGIAPFFILHRYLRGKWRALATVLREGVAPHAPSYQDRLAAGWARTVETCLRRARGKVSCSDVPGREAAAAALEKLLPLHDAIATLTISTAADALASGEVQSCLVRAGDRNGGTAYVLVFPAEHGDGRGVRRHQALAAGWNAHAEAIRRRIRAGQLPPVLLLAFFLHPEARRGSMVVGYDDGQVRITPAALLEARAQRDHSGGLSFERTHFELSAEA